MSLRPPPEDPAALAAFPRLQLRGRRLCRIHRHRDPVSGRLRDGFHFASAPGPAEGGRYDLPAPHGACHLAGSEIGAWLETFRSTPLVDLADVLARRLLVTRVPRSLQAADLAAPGARGFGITGEIHTVADYALPRAWAARLHAAGFRALRGKLRHDPALREEGVTLLDRAGAHPPYGWRWHTETRALDRDPALLAELHRRGLRVAARPYDVAVAEPPSH